LYSHFLIHSSFLRDDFCENGVFLQQNEVTPLPNYWGYSYFRALTAHCFKCNCNLFRIII
jgi:hypothetical protein